MSSFDSQLSKQGEKFSGIREAIKSEIESLARRFEKFSQWVNPIKDIIDPVANAVLNDETVTDNRFEETLDRLNAKLARIDRRLNQLELRQTSAEKRIDELERLVLQLRDEIKTTSNKPVPDLEHNSSPVIVQTYSRNYESGAHPVWNASELCPSRKQRGKCVNMLCEDGVVRHGNAFEDCKGKMVLFVHEENGSRATTRPSNLSPAIQMVTHRH